MFFDQKGVGLFMSVDSASRLQRIRQRTMQKRRRAIRGLSALSLGLFTGIGILLSGVRSPGIAVVPDGNGSLLLRSGAEGYIVVGIIAFMAGVFLTVGCIRFHRKRPSCTKPEKDAQREGDPSGGENL